MRQIFLVGNMGDNYLKYGVGVNHNIPVETGNIKVGLWLKWHGIVSNINFSSGALFKPVFRREMPKNRLAFDGCFCKSGQTYCSLTSEYTGLRLTVLKIRKAPDSPQFPT